MSKAQTFFITGTDTDVGKTFVSCGLLKAAQLAGYSCAAVKPVAAGAEITNEELQNEDAQALQKASSLTLSYEQVNPVCFEPAIAPHIAAQQAKRKVKAAQLAGYCRGVMFKRSDLTLIEGAGGWRVPISSKELMSDLVKELKVPVIMVVAMRLGCINHALLTVQAIQSDGLTLAGWVANQTEENMPVYQENIKTLQEQIPAPLLAQIDFISDFSSESSCADAFNVSEILSAVSQ